LLPSFGTDEGHEGKNNWASVFLAGLVDGPVQELAYAALNRPGGAPWNSLIVAYV
jgi:hypothetical protein